MLLCVCLGTVGRMSVECVLACVLSENAASLHVCVRVRQEGGADGNTDHFDNKGKRTHTLLFYLGSPEEIPLFL